MHGGTVQAAPKGDPKRGGRPPGSGLYAKYLSPSMAVDYAEAANMVGGLDHEIHLLRAHLARATEQYRDDPDGGTVVYSGDGDAAKSRARLHSDVIAELTDKIRRLERTRAQLDERRPPAADDLDGYQAWLAKRGG